MIVALAWLTVLATIWKLVSEIVTDWWHEQPQSAYHRRQESERARNRAEGSRKMRQVVERCQFRLDQLNERSEARKRGEEWVKRYDEAHKRIMNGPGWQHEREDRADALTNEQFKNTNKETK